MSAIKLFLLIGSEHLAAHILQCVGPTEMVSFHQEKGESDADFEQRMKDGVVRKIQLARELQKQAKRKLDSWINS